MLASLDFSQLWGSPLEMFAVITGVICVGLITFENTSRSLAWHNWWIGILTSAAYVYIFWQYKLYFNSLLQIFYVVTGFYGAWAWKRGGAGRTELLVNKAKPWLYLIIGAIIIASSYGMYLFMVHNVKSSAAPFWDALVVTLSLSAQFVMTRKYLEHWWLWIAVDIVGVALFASQGLALTSVLYFIYGSLCVRGIFTWHSAYRDLNLVTVPANKLTPTSTGAWGDWDGS